MKKTFFIIIILTLISGFSFAEEKKDCSIHKKIIDKMKCKASGIVKPSGFIKETIDKTVEYQKKAFDKKN